MERTTITPTSHAGVDESYRELEALTAACSVNTKSPVFTTSAEGLFDAYLAGIPDEARQHYNCNCCRRFVERYGGLVVIDKDGHAAPVFWTASPKYFYNSVDKIVEMLQASRVTGVFVSDDAMWGTPSNTVGPGSKYTGTTWSHLHCANASRWSHPLVTAEQKMAEFKHEYEVLRRGMSQTPVEAVVQAIRVLKTDVGRNEKFLPVAEWLLDLYNRMAAVHGRQRDNIAWLAVATAPPGWTHVRSTMISTLLDDIVAGLPYDTIKSRWEEKVHPLRYQRPTALDEGNVKQANDVIAKLGASRSLARRYARLEDVLAITRGEWVEPVGVAAPTAPVKTDKPFDSLLPSRSAVKPVELPPRSVGRDEFVEALRGADKCEVRLLNHTKYQFVGMITAVDPEAPPILQWDGADQAVRNPVSWYFYHGGSMKSRWGLIDEWVRVRAVVGLPHSWQTPGKFGHLERGTVLVLDGARDTCPVGCGWFPETLRSEFHGIRKAMEAYARAHPPTEADLGSANGVALSKDEWLTVRITRGGVQDTFNVRL